MENWSIGVLEWCIVAGLLHFSTTPLLHFVYGTEELPSAHTDSSAQVTSRFHGNHRMEAGKPAVSAVPWFGFATAAEESGLYNSKLCQTAVSVGAIDPFGPFDFAQGKTFAQSRLPNAQGGSVSPRSLRQFANPLRPPRFLRGRAVLMRLAGS